MNLDELELLIFQLNEHPKENRNLIAFYESVRTEMIKTVLAMVSRSVTK